MNRAKAPFAESFNRLLLQRDSTTSRLVDEYLL